MRVPAQAAESIARLFGAHLRILSQIVVTYAFSSAGLRSLEHPAAFSGSAAILSSARARPNGRERSSNPPRPQKRPLWPAITLCRTETLIELLFHGEPQKRERSSGRRPGMKIPGRCFLLGNFRLCRGIQKALALSRKYESNLPQPLPAESPPSA